MFWESNGNIMAIKMNAMGRTLEYTGNIRNCLTKIIVQLPKENQHGKDRLSKNHETNTHDIKVGY